jgi:hypothetical protein
MKCKAIRISLNPSFPKREILIFLALEGRRFASGERGLKVRVNR